MALDVFIANFEHILSNYVTSQPAFTCSKLTIETLEQGVKNMVNFNNKDTRTTRWRRSGVFIVNFE